VNDNSQVLKKDTLLIVETGEYSDRSWNGPVRMIKDAVKTDLADAYRRDWKPEFDWQEGDRPEPDGFLPWLVKAGYAEHVEGVTSWHVGSYGDFEP
jgi:hypothetical protein